VTALNAVNAVVSQGRVDALLIVRKAAGLEANP
jgi:hypothetical protein